MLSLIVMNYRKENSDEMYIELPKLQGIAKVATSTVSLLFFEFSFTSNQAMWLLINHLAAIVCMDSRPRSSSFQHLPPEKTYSSMATEVDVSGMSISEKLQTLPENLH
ncbi:hypothetical protein ScPMuIL_007502 [Solemya velum]